MPAALLPWQAGQGSLSCFFAMVEEKSLSLCGAATELGLLGESALGISALPLPF